MTSVYSIVPPSSKVVWFYALVVLILALTAGYLTASAWKARRMHVELSGTGVTAMGEYSRFVSRDMLRASEARVVDLTRDTDFALRLRTNGSGLPGYQVGWFETRAEGKIFAMVTDPHRVVYVPVRDAPGLLLSVANPERFIHDLRERSGNAGS
ncbi:MAG TPA: PH domain-containing protein [Gemmatimonadaceae bacterium]